MMRRVLAVVAVVPLLTTSALGVQAPTTFRKLDFYIQQGDEMDDEDAQMVIDPSRRWLVFAHEDDASRIFATVEWDRITSVSYENSKHARITAGLLVAWPLFFLKGKKHWLTVTYGPGDSGAAPGYVFARMDKDNFQAILAAINGYTGYEIRRIEEDGQISIVYPGVQPAEPVGDATSQPTAVSSATPASEPSPDAPSALPAAALPGSSSAGDGSLPAGSLPPTDLATPTLLNKGVEWTTRIDGVVGYTWAAEVANPNPVEVSAEVVLVLQDSAGEALHTDRYPVVLGADESASFTDQGEIEVTLASRGSRWTFHVRLAETGLPE